MYLVNENLEYSEVCDAHGETIAKIPACPKPAVDDMLVLPEFTGDEFGQVYKVTEVTLDYVEGVLRIWTKRCS